MSIVEWTIFGGTLLFTLAIALWARGHNHTRDDFFFAGRNVPWWLVGMSLSANCICGADIAGIAGWVFVKDLRFSAALVLSPLLVVIYKRLWMPVWQTLQGQTVFEYLEARFSKPIRILCSAIFVLGGLVIIASPLYMTSLFLQEFTGIAFYVIAPVLMLLLGIYSVLGGARADILTDCVQLVLFIGGVIAAAAYAIHHSGGFTEVWQQASAQTSSITGYRPTTLVSWRLSLSEDATIWALLSFYVQVCIFFGVNQMAVQRVECTPYGESQTRALWFMTAINMLAIGVLAVLGLGLIAYGQTGAGLEPGIGPDAVFPKFISHTLPSALKGAMLAAILLATMSTVDSGLNSYGNVVLSDLLERVRPFRHNTRLSMPRLVVATLCFVTLGIALLLYADQSTSIITKIGRTCSMLGAPVTAVFLAGLFLNKASSKDALLGMVLGTATFFVTKHYVNISWMYYFVLGTTATFAWIWIISIASPSRHAQTQYTWRQLRNRTVR